MEEGAEQRQTTRVPATPGGSAEARRQRFARWSYGWVSAVVVVGVLVTAALALVSARLASSNERHLLRLRSKEVASVFTAALPSIQTPLGAALALANLTHADPAKFTQFASAYVGRPGSEFVSVSVWRVGQLAQGPIVVVGTAPELPRLPGGIVPLLRAAERRTAKQQVLAVRGLLRAPQRR
ncbi:MAG: hypothetical protein KGL16_05940, partial [Acidobacteriota bacterium]|nr:hypothetical protein [Acidobacteriota bacterium]